MRCDKCGRKLKNHNFDCANPDPEYAEAPEAPRTCVLVWTDERRAFELMLALWPHAVEVLEPDEPGDRWGARLACSPQGLDATPLEYEIVGGKLQRLGTELEDALAEIALRSSGRR